MFSSIGSPSIMFDRIGAAVERMAHYKAILRTLPRVCLISTRTFPVIFCMAFCAAALAGKSPPSRGENNRGASAAIGKRLPIIDGDLHKVHAMPVHKGRQIGRHSDSEREFHNGEIQGVDVNKN